MKKDVLIISTSLRKNSNSNTLADAFMDGAKEAGNKVEKICLAGKTINFCKGCLACQKTQQCIIKDDAVTITGKMLHADVLVFATPIYYYEMSGQMKTLLDRANPLFPADYAFRDVYLLTTAADNGPYVPERAVNGLQGWINCFRKAKLAGTVFAGGVNGAGEIKGHQGLDEAYKMGLKV